MKVPVIIFTIIGLFYSNLILGQTSIIDVTAMNNSYSEKKLLLYGPDSSKKVEVCVKSPGQLSSLLSQGQQDTCQYLVIKGKLNSDDIRFLRRMAGSNDNTKTKGRLVCLDLSMAKIVKDKEPYLEIDSRNGHLGFEVKRKYVGNSGGGDAEWRGRNKQKGFEPLHKAYHNDNQECWFPDTVTQKMPKAVVGSYIEFYLKEDANNSWEKDCKRYADSRRAKRLQAQGMKRQHGHEIIKKEDQYYVMRCYLQSKRISRDMFFGCNKLRFLILPKGYRIDYWLHVYTSQENEITYIYS